MHQRTQEQQEQQAELQTKRWIFELEQKLSLLQLATIQTQKGQKEEGECYHTKILVLQQDRPYPNGMQKKKIYRQTSDLEEERNQVFIPQQQNLYYH